MVYFRTVPAATELQHPSMILDWFNAREAVAVGNSLANCLMPTSEGAVHGGSYGRGGLHRDAQKLLRRAARDALSLKLNLYQRAKLLSSFKWTLLEHGLDRKIAEELTHVLLLQLSSERTRADFSDSFRIGRPTLKSGEVAASAGGSKSRRALALLAEADTCAERGAHAEAGERLRDALALDPDDAVAHAKLGAVLCNLGSHAEAERELRCAVRLGRRLAEPHLNLGILLFWKGEFTAAETALRRAVKLDPRNAEALVSLGLTLGALRRLADAKAHFEKALRLEPGNVSARCGLGWLAAFEGRFDESERLYRDALEAEPERPCALAAIAGLRRMTTADESWADAVERALAKGVPPLEEARLRFALGKYFDDVASFPRAFDQYQRANELYKKLVVPYDREARTAFVDDVIQVYTRERVSRTVEGASASAMPIFVVGMMRSGTSLVEQIIASHPRAAGAGELDFWNVAAHKNRERLRREAPDPALARKLAESYAKSMRRHAAADALRVVDKSTINSDHLGLIHSVFPSARVIYLERDPIDTCLSCYFQNFANASSFTLDLSDLAHYYREHHRLMNHWRSALPPGTLLEVPYAGLVADQETWSRRIIEFAGLDWDPRCLEFHMTRRPVLTASNWQVRQKIYSSSVGRWRNYEKFIKPLLELRDLA